MNNSLMQIEADALALEQLIFEQGGELNETIEQWLAEVDQKLAQKVDSYNAVMDRFESTAAHLKKKADTFSAAARAVTNVRERLKDRIKNAMTVLGKTEMTGDHVVFKMVRTAPRLELNEKDLPAQYMIVRQITEPDKERIKNELKDGIAIPGAALLESFALRPYVKKGDK